MQIDQEQVALMMEYRHNKRPGLIEMMNTLNLKIRE